MEFKLCLAFKQTSTSKERDFPQCSGITHEDKSEESQLHLIFFKKKNPLYHYSTFPAWKPSLLEKQESNVRSMLPLALFSASYYRPQKQITVIGISNRISLLCSNLQMNPVQECLEHISLQ